jgi:hypothetical protein
MAPNVERTEGVVVNAAPRPPDAVMDERPMTSSAATAASKPGTMKPDARPRHRLSVMLPGRQMAALGFHRRAR